VVVGEIGSRVENRRRSCFGLPVAVGSFSGLAANRHAPQNTNAEITTEMALPIVPLTFEGLYSGFQYGDGRTISSGRPNCWKAQLLKPGVAVEKLFLGNPNSEIRS
jgi:hypothetical protein